jgi:hypothetical protein
LKPSFALESQKRLDVICVVDFAADVDERLIAFNNQTSVLNVYKLEDAAEADVRFSGEATDKEVTEFFELEKNATHVMFRKRMNVSDLFTEDFSKARFKKMGRNFFKFGIEIFNKYETKIDHKLCRMRFILNSIFS